MLLNDIRVSRETTDRLECFAALFLKWSNSINLVAPSTIESLWQRHIADSAQIFQLHPRPSHWVDIGSGGGFPGVITAIFLAELQDGWVDLVESNQKKAAFLRVALLETGARGSVRAMRVEDSYQLVPAVDCVSARALDDLDGLLGLCQHWLLADNTRAYFHKGRDYRSEIDKARGRWSFDVVEHRSAVEDDSIILEISALQPRSS